MFVPQTAEYALRAMAHIVVVPNGCFVSADALSSTTDIPRHYIAKILRKLVSANLLYSQSGPGGGVRLARSPHEVRVVDVLQAVQYPIEPQHCAFGWGNCDSESPCPLHFAWSDLKSNFYSWAESTTFQDVKDNSGWYVKNVCFGFPAGG